MFLSVYDCYRQLVELLKERHETRVSIKREARKAKYQQQVSTSLLPSQQSRLLTNIVFV